MWVLLLFEDCNPAISCTAVWIQASPEFARMELKLGALSLMYHESVAILSLPTAGDAGIVNFSVLVCHHGIQDVVARL